MRFILIFTLLFAWSCASKNHSKNNEVLPVEISEQDRTEFNQYWYAGKAEISTYKLEQLRYGQVRDGKQVMIFVTEDYNIDKQVKKEYPSQDKSASIMKLNKIDRFTTGIYDYSVMTSVFTPVDLSAYNHSFKINNSCQDWCGQSWSELLWNDGTGFQFNLNSYFESEATLTEKIGETYSEDELYTLMRIDTKKLPVGEFDIIPSLTYTRYTHEKMAVQKATGSLVLQVQEDGAQIWIYTVIFEDGRTLRIDLQPVFPHRILAWEEKVKTASGWLTSKATLDRSLHTDYWNQNGESDIENRKLLGL